MAVQINELAINRPAAPGTTKPDAGLAALAGLAKLVRILHRDGVLSTAQCREVADEVAATVPGAAWQFP